MKMSKFSRPINNYRLIVGKNKLLGNILLLKDRKGNHSLKIAFSLKTIGSKFFLNPERTGNVSSFDLESHHIVASGISSDISYKFTNQKLEIKDETSLKIERSLYDVDIPSTGPLFMLRLSDLAILPVVELKVEDLLITEGLTSNSFAICFSFPGVNGKPWTDILMNNKDQNQIQLKFRNLSPKELWIIASSDEMIPRGAEGLSIWLPGVHRSTKITS